MDTTSVHFTVIVRIDGRYKMLITRLLYTAIAGHPYLINIVASAKHTNKMALFIPTVKHS